MKKLLLPIFLLTLFGHHATDTARGQSAQVPACAAGSASAAASPALQTPALSEANGLNAKVVQLFRERKFDEALTAAERVLEIMEGAFGANHRCVADALTNVGALRSAKEEFDTAETLYRRALVIYDATGQQDSPAVVGVLDRLVFLSAVKRNLDKAEASAQRIVSIAEKKYKPHQIEMARALTYVAEVARLKLDNKRARSLYARVVEIVEQYAPASVPTEIRNSLANYLGILYAEEGGKDSELTERINKLFVAIASVASPAGNRVVEGGVINGKALYKPQPEYPPLARAARAQGLVQVKVTVDETGKVIEAKVFDNSPHPALSRASEEAARRARFTPTLLSGAPVKVNGIITYRFLLQ
ncbi:MAG TPA: TonB family protein [Pyrinomonadaceae bacterium]|jgi:TonB family protein|nr:TonB family protein [Pyrinomonadaceae bacterium]